MITSSEALTFKNVSVQSSDGTLAQSAAEAVVVQPGVGVVVFVAGEPRFVLRQDEGIDVFPSRTDTKEMSVVSGSHVIKLQFLSEGNSKSFRQSLERKNLAGGGGGSSSGIGNKYDTNLSRNSLNSSLSAEVSMAKASTAMNAASRVDDYMRRGLASELSQRRDRHRALAEKFQSGSDADQLLLREKFSAAAERNKHRLDQVENRHIERLEAALMKSDVASASSQNNNNPSSSSSNGSEGRQKLWQAWAEAEAYRDNDIHRAAVANKKDNAAAVTWQETHKRRQEIFDQLQSELRSLDATQAAEVSPSPMSPQSARLVEQVRSLLNEQQHAVTDARSSGASIADQQIAEDRLRQAEMIRFENERREKELREREAALADQRKEEEARRKKWEEEQAEAERQRRLADLGVRMIGDWKEMKHPESGESYYLNVVSRKVTYNADETPFAEPKKIVHQPDPVLAKQKMPEIIPPKKEVQQQPQKQTTTTTPSSEPVKKVQAEAKTTTTATTPQDGEVKGDWKAKKDAASGRMFFINTKTKKTTWKIEETDFAASTSSSAAAGSSAAAAPQDGEVRGEWKAKKDAASGRMFYINTATKKTTWKVEETSFAASVSSSSNNNNNSNANVSASSSSPPQDGEIKGDWKAKKDAASGRMFFFNTKTKKTTWKVEETDFASSGGSATTTTTTTTTAPQDGEVKGDWKAKKDAASGRIFFVNTKTKKTTWKIEETDFASSSSASTTKKSSSSSPPQDGEVKGVWKAKKDAASGRMFYINTETKKTTWKVEETSFA